MLLPQLKQFLTALGVRNLQHSSGDWAQASCPLAPFTHKAGKDGNPSFAVSVGPGKSHFNCFVCHSGSLEKLVQTLEFYVKQSPEQADRYQFAMARTLLDDEKAHLAPLPPYSEFTPSEYASFCGWPDHFIEGFPKWSQAPICREYLAGRGVTPEVAAAFDLRFDAARMMVVAPFRTASGVLAGARGRSIDSNVPSAGKHYDYTWNKANNTGLVWFNERALALPGPLVVVEGQFDAMAVWPHHQKVVGVLSSKTTPYKMKKLQGVGPVAVFLDNDETGYQKTWGDDMHPGWLDNLQRLGIPCAAVEYPEQTNAKDPGELPPSELAALMEDLRESAKSV